jgi:hypothetical protein
MSDAAQGRAPRLKEERMHCAHLPENQCWTAKQDAKLLIQNDVSQEHRRFRACPELFVRGIA